VPFGRGRGEEDDVLAARYIASLYVPTTFASELELEVLAKIFGIALIVTFGEGSHVFNYPAKSNALFIMGTISNNHFTSYRDAPGKQEAQKRDIFLEPIIKTQEDKKRQTSIKADIGIDEFFESAVKKYEDRVQSSLSFTGRY
jgi:hypothetical protein